jgi:hypothetical protein
MRVPVWAAVAIPAAAYVIRSVARGFDFRPDLPLDALVYAMLGLLILAVVVARRSERADAGDDDLAQQVGDEHRSADDGGNDC